jgi:DNA polymerase-3 subunit beta
MKVECIKNKLKDAVLLLEHVTGKKLSLPVLSYILFLASDGKIKLRATNLEIGVEISFPAKIQEEGVIAVPGNILGGLLSYLSDEKNIQLELIGQNLTISSDKQSTIVKCFPYEDFPSIPLVNKGFSFQIESKQLIQGLKSVITSAAQNDTKPEFSSVFLYSESGSLNFVATDSSRLAEKKLSIKGIEDGLNALIPAKNTIEIIRLLENITGSIDVCVTKSQIAFKNEYIYITSRLFDGVFPDYKQIIPKQTVTEVVILKEDFQNALKVANVFSGKLQQIRMKFYPQEKIFEIESRNDEVGEHTHRVDATIKGEALELVFNQKYISDALSIIQQDSIVIFSGGVGRPIILRGVSDQSFTYLVMPMRII